MIFYGISYGLNFSSAYLEFSKFYCYPIQDIAFYVKLYLK